MAEVRRAIGFTPMETRRPVIVELARIGDELGYEFVVVPEAWGHDSTILSAEIALATERIRPFTAILSIWGRTAATIAMNTASLLDLSNGRYVVGLGVSTPALAEGFHDVRYERPARRLEETAAEVRRLLTGERATLTVGAESGARPLALGQRVTREPTIAIAGMGPRTKQVTAIHGDLWAPVFIAKNRLPEQVAEIRGIRGDAGLDPQSLQTMLGPLIAIDDDLDTARAMAASNLAFYVTAMGDNYARQLTEQGYGHEVQAIIEANPRPRPGSCVVPPGADVLAEQLIVACQPDQANDALAEWDELGDVVMIGLPPGAPAEMLIEIVRAAAPR